MKKIKCFKNYLLITTAIIICMLLCFNKLPIMVSHAETENSDLLQLFDDRYSIADVDEHDDINPINYADEGYHQSVSLTQSIPY